MKTKVTSRPNPGSRKRRFARRHHRRMTYGSYDLACFIDNFGEQRDLARNLLRDFVADEQIWKLMERANALTEERRSVLHAMEKRRTALAKKYKPGTSNDKPKARKRPAGGNA
jgi:hypothetical protein